MALVNILETAAFMRVFPVPVLTHLE
jgi:hypothetical protein